MKKAFALILIAGLTSGCANMDSSMSSDDMMMKEDKMMDSMESDKMMMDNKKMESDMMMEEKKMGDMSM